MSNLMKSFSGWRDKESKPFNPLLNFFFFSSPVVNMWIFPKLCSFWNLLYMLLTAILKPELTNSILCHTWRNSNINKACTVYMSISGLRMSLTSWGTSKLLRHWETKLYVMLPSGVDGWWWAVRSLASLLIAYLQFFPIWDGRWNLMFFIISPKTDRLFNSHGSMIFNNRLKTREILRWNLQSFIFWSPTSILNLELCDRVFGELSYSVCIEN